MLDEARDRELESNPKQLQPRRWIVWLSGVSIFLLESRAIAFSTSAFMVFLSIDVLYTPHTSLLRIIKTVYTHAHVSAATQAQRSSLLLISLTVH